MRKKFHKVSSRDVEAFFYDGKNGDAIEKANESLVTVNRDADTDDVTEIRFQDGGSTRTLYPGQWLVFDGTRVEAVKDSKFQEEYVEAK